MVWRVPLERGSQRAVETVQVRKCHYQVLVSNLTLQPPTSHCYAGQWSRRSTWRDAILKIQELGPWIDLFMQDLR
ncbi:MAG: hypothetical protein OJF51_001427 [Nitrospira sp.]|nr:MAG: hypothetical protein OJF51_001427 [Nitrospira sp.]